MHPSIFESGGFVVGQADLTFQVAIVDGRQQPQFDQQLKSVADTQDYSSVAVESDQVIDQASSTG